MEDHRSRSRLGLTSPSVRNIAFVVHFTWAGGDPADRACGRVEHVETGRVTRFEATDELVGFMRQTLAAIAIQGEEAE